MKPKVWILTDGRIGDLKQMQLLAAYVGWPTVLKNLTFGNRFLSSLPFLAPWSMELSSAQMLRQPLPELIICAGGRTAAVALALKRWHKGTVKIVCMGRPRANFSSFDLIITTPQFGMPKASNVLELALPPTEPNSWFKADVESELLKTISCLPKPRIAVLVGGSSPPYIFDEGTAKVLSENINAYVQAKGGSLLLTTSLRTGSAVESAIKENIAVKNECFFWSSQRDNNPYHAYLAAADEFIVTADSVSMVADAITTGKPVYIYDLPQRWKLVHRIVNHLAGGVYAEKSPFWAHFVSPLFNCGIFQKRADRAELYHKLSNAGKIAFFGQPAPANVTRVETPEIDVAVQRVKNLFTL